MPWFVCSIEVEKSIFQRFSAFLQGGGFSDHALYIRERSNTIVLVLLYYIKIQKINLEMQTGDLLRALSMVLSCLTEDFPIGWYPWHIPRSMRAVRFPLGAAHHPPFQVEDIICFLDSGYIDHCKNG